MAKQPKERKFRKQFQWAMIPFIPFVIVGGYFWPYAGFSVVAMIGVFLVLSSLRGRMYCGWACPMGSFHERVLSWVSLKRDIPALCKKKWFRWMVFIAMMGLMSFRLILSGGDLEKLGAVFSMMWVISMSAAIVFGVIFKPRSWCSFCPMGTMQGVTGYGRYLLKIGEECRECGLCRRVCPIQTYPGSHKSDGEIKSGECMRCFNCVENCPTKALSFD